jgi:serine/threonine protein kinase
VLQIFDFGLCRELPPGPENSNDDLYFMTAAGTQRYMAPEVLMGNEYNLRADVYSWAMVYYECLAQEAPFHNLSDKDHRTLVCERHHRPHHFFGCVVPQSIQKLLGQAWEHDIHKRLTMQDTVVKLQDILVHTFQQTLTEGPDGVQVLVSQDHRDDEKSSSSSFPTSHTTLTSLQSAPDCSVCAGLKEESI